MKTICIIGASGHGKVIADIAHLSGYEEIFFLDDDETLKTCGEYSVRGKTSEISRFDGDVAIAVGNATIRKKFLTDLENQDRNLPVLIHPKAVMAEGVTVGAGTVIMAGAVVNPGATIGKGCIINTSASVDHDCVLGDYVHVSVGAHLAGTVHVGENTWIGIGSVISNNISLCADVMLGAGCVVVRDLAEPGTYVGVPARKI